MSSGLTQQRWRSRRWSARLVRLAVYGLPVLVAVAAALGFAQVVHPWRGSWQEWGRASWWLVVFGLAVVVLSVTERLTRRALPFASLLGMSLLFPGRAPRRLAVAREASSARNLQRRFASPGEGEAPGAAAERLLALVFALGVHDRRSGAHSERVLAYADLVAIQMKLPEADRDRLRWAALLHDIGKLHLSEELVSKAGTPNDFEWERLRLHTVEGDRLLGGLAGWLGPWALALVEHHERWDGEGYPGGLAADAISPAGRIIGAVDAFEVMTATKSYRKRPMRVDEAFQELVANAGSQFDPVVVRAITSLPAARLHRVAGLGGRLSAVPLGNGLRRTARAGRAARDATLAAVVAVAALLAGLLTPPSATGTAILHSADGPPPAATPTTAAPPTTATAPSAASGVTGGNQPFQLFPGSAQPAVMFSPGGTFTLPVTGATGAVLPVAAVSSGAQPAASTGTGSGGATGAVAAPVALSPTPMPSTPVVTVLPDAPQAAADSASTPVNTAVVIPVLGNDHLGSPIQLRVATRPSRGSVSNNGDGTLTYSPAAGLAGFDQFSYIECDGWGRCASAPVTVHVVAPAPPVAVADLATATSGAALFVPVLGNDHLAGPVSLTIPGPAAHGTALVDLDGTVSYTSNPGYLGPDAFIYQVCDPVGQCSSSTVGLVVKPPAPPLASADAVSTKPGQPVIVNVEANDTVPSPATLTIDTAPASGTAAVIGGRAVSYQPGPAFTGSDSFTYRLCDAFSQCATATVSVTVSAGAPAQPVAVADAAVVPSGGTVSIAVLANDAGSWVAGTLAVISGPAHGTATPAAGGTITYQGMVGYGGGDSFGYLVCDASARCGTAQVSVGVLGATSLPAPGVPVAVGDLALTPAGSPVSVAVLANDAFVRMPAAVSVVGSGPAGGTVTANLDGTMTYTPNGGFSGVDSWVYQVCNPGGGCGTAAVAVMVVPSTPVLGPVAMPAVAVAAGGPVTVGLVGADSPGATGSPLVASSVAAAPSGPAPAHGTVVFGADGSVAYTPAGGYDGPDVFGYEVCDGASRCSTSLVVITVTR